MQPHSPSTNVESENSVQKSDDFGKMNGSLPYSQHQAKIVGEVSIFDFIVMDHNRCYDLS